MNKKGSSDKLETLRVKAAMLAYFHFRKRFDLVCCEFDYGSADILAVSGYGIFEVEVKVSIADMRREIKKFKHNLYSHHPAIEKPSKDHPCRYFSFAVPEVMKDEAFVFCKSHFPLAGLYVLKTDGFSKFVPGIDSKIKAQPLKPYFYGNRDLEELKLSMVHGMGNNLVNAYYGLFDSKKALLPLKLI
jgi:hypothetical protein